MPGGTSEFAVVPVTVANEDIDNLIVTTSVGATATGDPLYQAISDGRRLAGMEHWLPLFHDRLETLVDYCPEAVFTADHQIQRIAVPDQQGPRSQIPMAQTNFGQSVQRPAQFVDDLPYR